MRLNTFYFFLLKIQTKRSFPKEKTNVEWITKTKNEMINYGKTR
jgi:hypothetical protein